MHYHSPIYQEQRNWKSSLSPHEYNQCKQLYPPYDPVIPSEWQNFTTNLWVSGNPNPTPSRPSPTQLSSTLDSSDFLWEMGWGRCVFGEVIELPSIVGQGVGSTNQNKWKLSWLNKWPITLIQNTAKNIKKSSKTRVQKSPLLFADTAACGERQYNFIYEDMTWKKNIFVIK